MKAESRNHLFVEKGHIKCGVCISWQPGCFPRYADQVGCVLILVAVGRGPLMWISGSQYSCHSHYDWRSLSPMGPCPRVLTLFRGTWFIAWHLRRPSLGGNTNRAQGIFGTAGCVWATVQRHLPYSRVRGALDNYRCTWSVDEWLCWRDPIYPTPPLGQDMTQGQFLSGV